MATSKTLTPVKNNDGTWVVMWDKNGGTVPQDISGTYTSEYLCKRAIDTFQARVRDKVAK